MTQYLKKKFSYTDKKNLDAWVKIFVYQVENPRDKVGGTKHRQKVARALDKQFKASGR